jgi:hypothetical protein
VGSDGVLQESSSWHLLLYYFLLIIALTNLSDLLRNCFGPVTGAAICYGIVYGCSIEMWICRQGAEGRFVDLTTRRTSPPRAAWLGGEGFSNLPLNLYCRGCSLHSNLAVATSLSIHLVAHTCIHMPIVTPLSLPLRISS